jgi:hypothetical protein
MQWKSYNGKRCNGRMCKGKTLLFLKVSLQSSWMIFADLPIRTLIMLFYDVTFKTRYLLFVVFLMYRVAQWQGIAIFLLVKVCTNLDFFLIAINNYEICLWVFECQHIENWNVASCNDMRFWNVIWYHIQCLGFSLISMLIEFSCLHISYFLFWI